MCENLQVCIPNADLDWKVMTRTNHSQFAPDPFIDITLSSILRVPDNGHILARFTSAKGMHQPSRGHHVTTVLSESTSANSILLKEQVVRSAHLRLPTSQVSSDIYGKENPFIESDMKWTPPLSHMEFEVIATTKLWSFLL
jgi:hypothetical protein